MPKMKRMIPAAMYRDPVATALGAFAGFGEDVSTSTGYYCDGKPIPLPPPGIVSEAARAAMAKDACAKMGGSEVTTQQIATVPPTPGYYGRQGDAWDSWCNKAADIWPGANKEALRHKCVDGNTAVPARFVAPWTVVGKVARGIPANFSNDPTEVAAGVVGKVTGTAGEVIDTTKKVLPTGGSGTGGTVTPGGGGSGQRDPDVGGSVQPPVLAEDDNTMMIVGGLAAVGLLLVLMKSRRKSGGAVAGFGSYRRRRRRVRR